MTGETPGIYGKIPAQPDFLKANAGEFSRGGLDQWFQEGAEILHAEGTRLPQEPCFFFVSTPNALNFVGALTPSRDAVGRSFPLMIFVRVPADSLTVGFPTLVVTFERFLASAAALLDSAAPLPAAELVARVQALPSGEPPFSGTGADTMALLAREPAGDLLTTLGGLPAGGAYAFQTMQAACDQAKRGAAARASAALTVDAPAPSPAARLLWLELARRNLRSLERIPTFLWTTGPSGRLLISLGEPTPKMIAYLANPSHSSSRRWPLHTDVGPATESALAAATSGQRSALESPQTTLADLLTAFSPPNPLL
jgi:type VI secretion system ImpM family protein